MQHKSATVQHRNDHARTVQHRSDHAATVQHRSDHAERLNDVYCINIEI